MTPEEIKKTYQQKIATSTTDEERNEAWIEYLNDKQKVDGDLEVFYEAQAKMLGSYNELMTDFYTRKTKSETEYIAGRGQEGIQNYHDRLVKLGLATGTLSRKFLKRFDTDTYTAEKLLAGSGSLQEFIALCEQYGKEIARKCLRAYHIEYVPLLKNNPDVYHTSIDV